MLKLLLFFITLIPQWPTDWTATYESIGGIKIKLYSMPNSGLYRTVEVIDRTDKRDVFYFVTTNNGKKIIHGEVVIEELGINEEYYVRTRFGEKEVDKELLQHHYVTIWRQLLDDPNLYIENLCRVFTYGDKYWQWEWTCDYRSDGRFVGSLFTVHPSEKETDWVFHSAKGNYEIIAMSDSFQNLSNCMYRLMTIF